MTTQGLLSGKTVWIVFAVYFLFLIAIARYTTWKEKRDAGKVDLQGGRFKWPVMVMTYIASCMSVWVFFAGPGAYYRYGLGYFFSEMCIYSMFPIICYFTMTKVWLVNQQKHFTTPADFFFCRYKSKALTVIIDIVYIICAVPFISAVLVAGGRAAEVATGGTVSSQTFTLICGIIMTVFVMLGGVKVPSDSGLIAHSDGDVLAHAVMDAMLSAAGLKDIGHYFPDSDEKWRNADSMKMLEEVKRLVADKGFAVKNLSAAIQAERPRLAAYIDGIRNSLATALRLDPSAVGISAGTNEGLGYIGEGRGITVTAEVLLCRPNALVF